MHLNFKRGGNKFQSNHRLSLIRSTTRVKKIPTCCISSSSGVGSLSFIINWINWISESWAWWEGAQNLIECEPRVQSVALKVAFLWFSWAQTCRLCNNYLPTSGSRSSAGLPSGSVWFARRPQMVECGHELCWPQNASVSFVRDINHDPHLLRLPDTEQSELLPRLTCKFACGRRATLVADRFVALKWALCNLKPAQCCFWMLM